MLTERHAYVSACIAAAVAAVAGDDERRDSGRREYGGGECTVECAASVAAATTPWPWCGNTCSRRAPRRAEPAGNQPRESAESGHPRVSEQYCW